MNIVIIGGGPSGLYLAYQFKKYYNKNINVSIVEKRKVYVRDYVIVFKAYLLPKMFDKITIQKMIKEGGCYIYRPDQNQTGICSQNPIEGEHSIFAISIKKLEKILFNICKKEKVKFIHTNSNDAPKKIIDVADIVFACDGSNSKIRKQMKIKEGRYGSFENYAMILTYTEKSRKSTSNKPESDLLETKQNRRRFFRLGKNNCYLGFQLSKDEIEQVNLDKEYTLKTLPNYFKKLTEMYFKYFDSYPKTKPKITFFPIELKYAEKVTGTYKGKPTYLVGDSSISSHFFTGYGLTNLFEEIDFLIMEFYKTGLHKKLTPKLFNSKIKKLNKLYQSRVDELLFNIQYQTKQVNLDFNQINNTCLDKTKDELYQQAQKQKLKIKNLTNKEICYTLN